MNTLIDNVRLWTGENAIDDACIQIKDTRIAYAGARAAAPEFAADTTIDGKGGITKQGEQVVLGAEDKYISLCRRHWKQGDPGPKLRKQ